jgi:hypothetical protein
VAWSISHGKKNIQIAFFKYYPVKKVQIFKVNGFNFLCVMHKFLLSLSILSQNFESVKSSEGFIFLVIQIHFPVHRLKTFSHLAQLVQIMKISLQLGGRFRLRSD